MYIKLVSAIIVIIVLFFGGSFIEFYQDKDIRSGYSLFKEGKYSLAINQLKPFAIEGDTHSRLLIAKFYALGLNSQKDKVEALKWLACTSNNCIKGKGELSIGLEFVHATLTNADISEACYWIQKSQDKGYAPAIIQYNQLCRVKE